MLRLHGGKAATAPDSPKSAGLTAASDIAKQIITLATGAVAFTVTFLDKFTKQVGGHLTAPPGLFTAWVLFGLTIGCALWTLMSITGTLNAYDRSANGWELTDDEKDVLKGSGGNVRIPALAMLASFFLAVAAMIWAGFNLVL